MTYRVFRLSALLRLPLPLVLFLVESWLSLRFVECSASFPYLYGAGDDPVLLGGHAVAAEAEAVAGDVV